MARLPKRRTPTAPPPLPSVEFFSQLQADNYRVGNLVGVSPAEFQARIEEFSQMDDSQMEGYDDVALQRKKSISFQWSEDQDFGTFQVSGAQFRERSKRLLAMFMDHHGVLEKDLSGKRVLDIGCWTGATSFLLAAMGAEVLAIEEVAKYTQCVNYLRDAFGLENLEARNLSLYDLAAEEFQDAFDIVLFAGVLYHLSDPIIGTG